MSRALLQRATSLAELMDAPDCDPVKLQRTLRRFAVVNRLIAGWRHTYQTYLRQAFARIPRHHPITVLDIGTGGGDVLRFLVHLAAHDGFTVHGVGIDIDDRAIDVARQTTPSLLTQHRSGGNAPLVEFRCASASDLVRRGEQYDVVISNHLLHHLPDFSVLDESRSLASRLVVHSDISRSRAAYVAYAIGITPLAPGTFLRTDGLRSIRRSFTRDELEAELPPVWKVEQPNPSRLLLLSQHRDTLRE